MDHPLPLARRPIEVPDAYLVPRDPVVGFRFGRGRTGGSTWLDTVIQLARVASRPVLVGDADRRNPTLSGLYRALKSRHAFARLVTVVRPSPVRTRP